MSFTEHGPQQSLFVGRSEPTRQFAYPCRILPQTLSSPCALVVGAIATDFNAQMSPAIPVIPLTRHPQDSHMAPLLSLSAGKRETYS